MCWQIQIEHFVEHYNKASRPFVWTATADSILAKLQRLCERITGTEHYRGDLSGMRLTSQRWSDRTNAEMISFLTGQSRGRRRMSRTCRAISDGRDRVGATASRQTGPFDNR